jgi:erythromycin esterase-like protein
VLIEADWPAAARLNAYVRGHPGATLDAALAGFRSRFAEWMWSNQELASFAERLRAFNATLPDAERRGVYGLDIYALQASADAVVAHLEAAGDVAGARAARRRFSCITRWGGGADYARALAAGAPPCRDEAVNALVATMRSAAAAQPGGGGPGSPAAEATLSAVANARAVASAESYYRAMVFGGEPTWNIRDSAFLDAALLVRKTMADAAAPGAPPPRLILWAHNSHLGNAAATSMGALRGEHNVGQLLVEAFGRRKVCAVGQLTAAGTVACASSWGGRVWRRAVRPPLEGSYEALLAASGRPSFTLDLRDPASAAATALAAPALQRAIGVQYRPKTERPSHYFSARLVDQFSAVVFFAESHAVDPVPVPAGWGTVLGYDDDSGAESD